MILVDTNVVSEFMTSPPHEHVRDWLNRQEVEKLFLPSIAVAEVVFGLGVMPDGRRRSLLRDRFEQFLALMFAGRILPFGEPEARIYGEIRAQRQTAGRAISNFDAQIAAIARCRGLALATRNVKDFADCGLELVNPWDRASGVP